jgi:hypothetical protein
MGGAQGVLSRVLGITPVISGITDARKLYNLRFDEQEMVSVTPLQLTPDDTGNVLELLLKGYSAGTGRIVDKKAAIDATPCGGDENTDSVIPPCQ